MANATVVRLRWRHANETLLVPAGLTDMAARTRRALRSLWCTMNGGHHRVLHTEPDRMSLRCVACGDSTPGWTVAATRPIPKYAGDPERFRMDRAASV